MESGGCWQIAGFICASGRVTALPPGHRESGATHALVDDAGRTLFWLRSRALTLDILVGRVGRVCGLRRGQVVGEPAAILDVQEACDLGQVPLVPGVDRMALGACLQSPGLPVRPFVGS